MSWGARLLDSPFQDARRPRGLGGHLQPQATRQHWPEHHLVVSILIYSISACILDRGPLAVLFVENPPACRDTALPNASVVKPVDFALGDRSLLV